MVDIRKMNIVILFTAILFLAMFCGNAVAEESKTSFGPAPNYGDGNPDGSGFDREDWPNEDSPAMGPAPNAGDGIPDGSGF